MVNALELSVKDVSALDIRLQCYRYVCTSGFVGAFATTLAKSCSGLLALVVSGDNQFGNSFTYIVIIGWFYTMQLWVRRMDCALKLFDTFAVPLLELVWTLFSIIAGGALHNAAFFADPAAARRSRPC